MNCWLWAGWDMQDLRNLNLYAARGVAVREFPLRCGQGKADCLLYVDTRAAGIVEAKPVGFTLTKLDIVQNPPEAAREYKYQGRVSSDQTITKGQKCLPCLLYL
jgi:hypothetical protein